jgi:hypothetical protein
MSDARGFAECQVGELAAEATARAAPVCQGRVLLEIAEGGSPVAEWLTAFRAARRRALPVCAQAQRGAAVKKHVAKLAGGAVSRQCHWIGWWFQFDHRCAAKETDVLQELFSGRVKHPVIQGDCVPDQSYGLQLQGQLLTVKWLALRLNWKQDKFVGGHWKYRRERR